MIYDRIEATAQRLIDRYGKAAQLVRTVQSGPSYAPVTEEHEYGVQMVETGYSLDHRADTLIQAGDKVGVIATNGEATPQLSDKLKLEGSTYSMVDLEPVSPGETTVLYSFQARR